MSANLSKKKASVDSTRMMQDVESVLGEILHLLRKQRERKRLAVQKVKEEARKRKQLMQEAENLKAQIEATEKRRAEEKKMSVAARLEEIRNAVGATADTLWE